MITLEGITLWVLAALVGSFLGNFLSGYLKQKGENLATHEDIDKLVDQVRAVTKATKEIESKISDEVWDRQKRWELKRDLIVEVVKKISLLQDALTAMHGVFLADKKSGHQRGEKRAEAYGAVNLAANEFGQAIALIDLVCEPDQRTLLLSYHLLAREVARDIVEVDPEILIQRVKELVTMQVSITSSLRKALGLPVDKPIQS